MDCLNNLKFNEYQSSIEDLHLMDEPDDVQEQFMEFVTEIPFVKSLIDPKRPRAKDLPRDEKGRIIVDITKPHIFENMDYFRPTAIHYQKTGRISDLIPNDNPNSEYGKWLKEEIRRCWDGYVRESDGEWITGDMYFFLNYCPILQTKVQKGKKALRIWDFPSFWEGHYYKFHYIDQARTNGHHGCELAARSKGKSYTLAAMLAKRFILGESLEVNREVACIVTAYTKEYLVKNGILNKFQSYIDFCAQNTQFPSKRLKSSLQDMQWKMGYLDLDTGTQKGTLNEVIGVTSKDDESKLRGKRGVLVGIEEMGSFPNLLTLYGTMRPNVEEGDSVFGMIYMVGTASEEASDFAAAQEIMYSPLAYNMQEIPNVYDKEGQGGKYFTYFFPGYISRKNCYDYDGNSDVTKAILLIIKNRRKTRLNAKAGNAVAQVVAEEPITPQEAILKARGSYFPITMLNERLNQLDADANAYNDEYIGQLYMDATGEVKFKPTNDIPIRDYPMKNGDNNFDGALVIYSMPKKNGNGSVFSNRYVVGHDPVADDQEDREGLSLCSTYVIDLYTEQIAAQYTGRHMYADDNYETVRLLCLFYNARCLTENNTKGIIPYFSKMGSLYLLAETPEYLSEMDLVRGNLIGNRKIGYNAVKLINAYANDRIKEWLLMPITRTVESDGDFKEVTLPNLYRIKDRALIKELIRFNSEENFDRVRALGAALLYREDFMVKSGGKVQEEKTAAEDPNYLGNSDFFKRNYPV